MIQALGARDLDAEIERSVPVLLKKAGELSLALQLARDSAKSRLE